MNNSIVLGIDIGGSHITAALVDLKTYRILPDTYVRKRLNAHENAANIINSWAEVIESAYHYAPGLLKKIGIAMPGPFDYEQGVCRMKDQDKYEALYGMNVKELLAGKLQMEADHIRFMNDACCFLKGEVLAGAASGFRHAIGLTLGTGLGSASYHDGFSQDADLWNLPFKDSIAEDYISSRWFLKTYYSISGKDVKDVKELAQLASDDEKAQEVFNQFGTNLGLFLSEFIAMKNPEVVVIGGNISQAAAVFLSATEKVLTDRSIETVMKCSTLGEEAALIGAAGCWDN